jgi:hypothetical protein
MVQETWHFQHEFHLLNGNSIPLLDNILHLQNSKSRKLQKKEELIFSLFVTFGLYSEIDAKVKQTAQIIKKNLLKCFHIVCADNLRRSKMPMKWALFNYEIDIR